MVKDYWKKAQNFEKVTVILNLIWLILSIIAAFCFTSFYSYIKSRYHDIYSVANAMSIINLDRFQHLFLGGFVFVVVFFFCAFFDFKIAFNFGNYLTSSRWIVAILGIINCIISYFALRYYILGIIFVGLVASGFSLLSSQ